MEGPHVTGRGPGTARSVLTSKSLSFLSPQIGWGPWGGTYLPDQAEAEAKAPGYGERCVRRWGLGLGWCNVPYPMAKGRGGVGLLLGCFCRRLASSLVLEAPGPHYSAFNSSKGAEWALKCKL